MPTFAFHFGEGDSVIGGLIKAGATVRKWYPTPTGAQVRVDNALPGYSAVLCGGNQTHKLHQAITTLQEVGYPIKGYVPAPTVRVDSGSRIYYTDVITPSNTKEYE